MAQMVHMTTEQVQKLIEAVRVAAASSTTAGDAYKATLSNCPSGFRGQRNHETVEEFITAVVTYKEVEGISDEDALKGISLLFFDVASTWWQGVRKEAKTWNDAIALIREHFAPTKPCYQIYMEFFKKKQDVSTDIDTFVCLKRALLAQLPDGRHDEETELDFVYALLNIRYRKHIVREDFSSFRELLEKGRIIEHNNQKPGEKSDPKKAELCIYCHFRGHNLAECLTRKRDAIDEDIWTIY